jgi:carboxyl-terminal processing protease
MRLKMQKFLRNKYSLISLSFIVIIALISGGFYFGYKAGTKKPQTVIIRGVANLEGGKLEVVDFSLFWDAWRAIKEKALEADKVSNQDLVYGAISGLIQSFNDPNSVFFPPSDAKKFNEDVSGEFSGIGAEIGIRNNQLVIIAPLKDTPAEKAGLRAGDKILKIDATSTVDLTIDEGVKLIRGQKGTTVVLTILREGWDKPKEISIVRDIIQIPTIDWKMIDHNIAYIHLYNFYEKAPLLFYQAAAKIIFKNPNGLILDLRDNPGGYLDAAVTLANLFLKPGEVVVSEEFKGDEKQVFKTHGNGLLKDIPLVILINEGSASASEILAGALKDNRGVKLVGKKSFGKGTVQELVPLKDNSMIKITVAHWRLPGGQLIEKNGLKPDYEVSLTDEDVKAGKDPQLEKAIEVLEKEIQNSKS